jgi:glutathione synthase/RimK-type ligase-like ATP-grasp enzyme
MRIALATFRQFPDLHEDDQILARAIVRRGIEVVPAVWDESSIEWRRFDACVLRSTWDYTFRRDEFCAWAARAATETRLLNPATIVRWNSHKGYLAELAGRGAPVVPTAFVRASEPFDLAAMSLRHGWDEVVVKPCVSAGARDTLRVRAGDGQAAAEAVRARGDLMVQPYQPEVEREGERSLIFVGGELTHAIRKHPALVAAPAGHDEPRVTPTDDEVAVAERVLSLVDEPLLYARVDLVRGADGPQLMELELIEPRLFLYAHPPAAERLADAIVRGAS